MMHFSGLLERFVSRLCSALRRQLQRLKRYCPDSISLEREPLRLNPKSQRVQYITDARAKTIARANPQFAPQSFCFLNSESKNQERWELTMNLHLINALALKWKVQIMKSKNEYLELKMKMDAMSCSTSSTACSAPERCFSNSNVYSTGSLLRLRHSDEIPMRSLPPPHPIH